MSWTLETEGQMLQRVMPELMDAIESGIVKLPRVPVAENIPATTCRCSATSGFPAFVELREIYRIESDFEAKVAGTFDEMIGRAGATSREVSA